MALSSMKKLYSPLTINLAQLQSVVGFRLAKHMIGAPISSFTDAVLCLDAGRLGKARRYST